MEKPKIRILYTNTGVIYKWINPYVGCENVYSYSLRTIFEKIKDVANLTSNFNRIPFVEHYTFTLNPY